MKHWIFLLSVAILGCAAEAQDPATKLHKSVPLIDGHNDLPWQYREKVNRKFSKLDVAKSQPELMTDIARLREGGVGAQFWSVYVPRTSPSQEALMRCQRR